MGVTDGQLGLISGLYFAMFYCVLAIPVGWLADRTNRTVTVKDPAAYGLICIQGYGRIGAHAISSPSLIRFGQMTEDEFFVTYDTARAGVTITNLSATEPLVILKHFNPGNPEMPHRAS